MDLQNSIDYILSLTKIVSETCYIQNVLKRDIFVRTRWRKMKFIYLHNFGFYLFSFFFCFCQKSCKFCIFSVIKRYSCTKRYLQLLFSNRLSVNVLLINLNLEAQFIWKTETFFTEAGIFSANYKKTTKEIWWFVLFHTARLWFLLSKIN